MKYGSLRLAEPPDPRPVLTWRQTLVLRVIKASVAERGYSPTYRQIGKAAHMTSSSSVCYQVSALLGKGYLGIDGDADPHRPVAGRAGRPRPCRTGRPSGAVTARESTPCPECGAARGELCMSVSGKETRDLHMARWRENDEARKSAEDAGSYLECLHRRRYAGKLALACPLCGPPRKRILGGIMSRHRLDMSTPEAPTVWAIVTTETRDRIIELATAKGISRSAVMRALIESALASLDAEATG
jgi:hypothetical protein